MIANVYDEQAWLAETEDADNELAELFAVQVAADEDAATAWAEEQEARGDEVLAGIRSEVMQ